MQEELLGILQPSRLEVRVGLEKRGGSLTLNLFAPPPPPAQSLVAPLGSLTLVANVLMAPWVLKETVTARDLKSTALIVLGCILAVAFASHSSAGVAHSY